MNINSNYSDEDNAIPKAQTVMDNGMGFIFDKLLAPMEDQLSQEDIEMLAVIGVSFKIIAEQAQKYEDSIANQMNNGDEQFYRN
jgi:hypothetical protein